MCATRTTHIHICGSRYVFFVLHWFRFWLHTTGQVQSLTKATKTQFSSYYVYNILLLTLIRDAVSSSCLAFLWCAEQGTEKNHPQLVIYVPTSNFKNFFFLVFFLVLFYCGCLNWLTLKRNRLPHFFFQYTRFDGSSRGVLILKFYII